MVIYLDEKMKTVIVKSDEKNDAYVATVLLFNQIRIMAQAKLGGWELTRTYTNVDRSEFVTRYSNGKMFIMAESIGDYHTYSFGKELTQ